ncbi:MULTISPECIES: Qat anti-phage system TatD family nuclease QatD [Enterobacterales]|nr:MULTISPECIES: Qat anti-phage system TatD family nuclease QatD [Enterobacterales]MBU9827965.1 TatD family hydrolase [Rahnella perminowiae]MCC2035796.1 TatD family hydrolase [Raoultella ornithinolytica]MCC2043419.1 TatD family hydrolase [Raoultella ornithinolytica]MCC2048244.1 TatD family hydrolase [Raoultella ornithinolytica]MCC2050137.1 TatD family hydrolase [Raoultella ornithinolytica]
MSNAQKKVSPQWVDFHCHLDLYPDHKEVIAECDRARVATLAVTTTPKAWQRNCELAEHSPFVRIGLGLHPQLVAEREQEVMLLERYLPATRYVGEIGLDAGPRFYKSFEAQERVFSRILYACAEQGNKILSIHSIRAAAKVLSHLEKSRLHENGQAILHWFTGTVSEARRAAELGCYFSINEEMLRSVKHRKLITSLPLNRLLTETDGPFIQNNAVSIRPTDVHRTVRGIAELHGLNNEVAASLILSNLRNLVTLSGKK